MTNPPAGFARYERRSSDGMDENLLCDGTRHATHLPASFGAPAGVHVTGPCDGSCKPEHAKRQVDLRAMLAEAESGCFHAGEPVMDGDQIVSIGGPVLRNRVRHDEASAALFASGRPLVGARFASHYCKRDSRSDTACLGNAHVRVAVEFDNLARRDTGFYKTYVVTAAPCDGSCRPVAANLPPDVLRQLADA